MASSARQRFIWRATAGYAVFALAWIFLSDQLLAEFTDVSRIVWLSTAKGLSFVVTTAMLLFFALRAVPTEDRQRFEILLTRDRTMLGWPAWLRYGVAVLVSGGFLLVIWSMGQTSGGAPVLMILLLPVTVCASVGGFGPGLCATVLCALGALPFVTEAGEGLHFTAPRELFRWALLIGNGLLISALCEVLHRAWQRLDAGQRFQAAILGSVGDAILVVAPSGLVSYANAEAERLYGRAVSDMIGRPFTAMFQTAEEEADNLPARICRLSVGEALAQESVLIRGAELVPVYLRAAPIRLEGGGAARGGRGVP